MGGGGWGWDVGGEVLWSSIQYNWTSYSGLYMGSNAENRLTDLWELKQYSKTTLQNVQKSVYVVTDKYVVTQINTGSHS